MLPAGEGQKETFLNTLQHSLHNYAHPQEKVVNQSLFWDALSELNSPAGEETSAPSSHPHGRREIPNFNPL